MKQWFLLWFLLICTIVSYAQIITIIDQETNKPLEGVFLSSESAQVSVITNFKGQADIIVFKEVDKIQIRYFGYKTLEVTYNQILNQELKIKMESFNLNLDQVVISASKYQQTTTDIPSEIKIISDKDVAFQNPQTAADLLSISGKVYIQKSQQGGGSPMIRGFSTNRLLYTVDGVRMNSAIFRGGNLQNVINIDPFAVEKTEVLFGPGTVIYGSDAIGGVMSFQTLTPQLSLIEKPIVTGKAVTRYSTANNEKTGHFDVNVGWKKWALVTSISSWDYDHLRQGRHGPDDYIKSIYVQRQDSIDVITSQEDPLLQIPTAYKQMNMMQKVRFKPNKKWDFQYGFHYSETSTYGRYDRNNRFRNGTLRYAEWNYGPQIWMMNNLSVNHKGNNLMYNEVTLRVAQQSFEESRINRSLNQNDRSVNTEYVEAYSANLDFSKKLSKKHHLFYGAEYIFDDVKSKGKVIDISSNNSQQGASRYPNAQWSSIAAYLNDQYKASDKLTVVMGLRYNQFMIDADFNNNLEFYPLPFSNAKLNSGALTGSIGTVYRPKKSWVINSNFGTAFRAPNVDDIGKVFDSEVGAVTVPNPDLKAEYAYNFDFGIAKVFGDLLKVDVTAYYTVLENALVRRNYQLGGQDSIMYQGELSSVQAIQNAAVINVYGIQAGLDLKLHEGFSFSSDINYQVGKEELDNGTTSPSRHAPPLFGVSRLNFNSNKLQMQFYANYMAERKFEDLPDEEKGKDEIYAKDDNGNNYSPAWYTLNLKLSYEFTETFMISSGIENLTDVRYRPYSSGISGAGRNFIISLKAEF
jgi:hemoglobin/transferrin/lactoferrin receptor protein